MICIVGSLYIPNFISLIQNMTFICKEVCKKKKLPLIPQLAKNTNTYKLVSKFNYTMTKHMQFGP